MHNTEACKQPGILLNQRVDIFFNTAVRHVVESCDIPNKIAGLFQTAIQKVVRRPFVFVLAGKLCTG